MTSQTKSFPCPDKQGTPEEGRSIQWPKRCVLTNNNKDGDNSPKNNTYNIVRNISINICIKIEIWHKAVKWEMREKMVFTIQS